MSARWPERGETSRAAREVEEVMRDLEKLESSVGGVEREKEEERCSSVEEMMPVSSALVEHFQVHACEKVS